NRLLAMPPSPGVDGWQAWVRPVADGRPIDHAVHAYGSFDQMRAGVEWVLGHTRGAGYVTEGNFGAGRSGDVTARAEAALPPFLDGGDAEPRVKLAAYFAWRWDQSSTLPTSVDAAGTAVETLLVNWTPPPVVVDDDPPWDGKTLTVWNLPDDPA